MSAGIKADEYIVVKRLQLKKSRFVSSKSKSSRYFVGRQIRAPKVLCIDSENVNRGVIPISDALTLAKKSGLDLVQISSSPKQDVPTCKILDYSKFKFDQSKRDRLTRKRQRETTAKVKEIKFRPSTDAHDLSIKAKQAGKFLLAGHKVKATIVFKGREISYVDDSRSTLRDFVEMIPDAQMLSVPSVSGRQLSVLIVSKTEKKTVEVA